MSVFFSSSPFFFLAISWKKETGMEIGENGNGKKAVKALLRG